ncbi:unnamed protein product [Linum trigynum]|uniref:Uncharacterized protein n=1 Tax=Linum trigynum TaxID=586398 RepID=A0AAV2GB70_9ROSI
MMFLVLAISKIRESGARMTGGADLVFGGAPPHPPLRSRSENHIRRTQKDEEERNGALAPICFSSSLRRQFQWRSMGAQEWIGLRATKVQAKASSIPTIGNLTKFSPPDLGGFRNRPIIFLISLLPPLVSRWRLNLPKISSSHKVATSIRIEALQFGY